MCTLPRWEPGQGEMGSTLSARARRQCVVGEGRTNLAVGQAGERYT